MSQSSLSLQTKAAGPVECLGQRFPSEEARREHYLKLLAQKLKDPEFRTIEGFPMGNDEEILVLSALPYYTAYPPPWRPGRASLSNHYSEGPRLCKGSLVH